MNKVDIEGVSFAYPGSDALVLKDVSLAVDDGDFVCLLGQSGCGKSTFLRMLAGLEKPTGGTISVDGSPIDGAGLDRAVVFQDYGLFPWMSAGENIVIALKQRYPGKKKAEYRQMAQQAIEEVGLAPEVFGMLPKELSGGMKQRCAIARAFSLNSPILLMDEPFGALDAVTRARLQDMVLDLWNHETQRKTVFFVTHDVEEALLLSTRIVVFGQSPSSIIFEKRINAEHRHSRADLYEDRAVIELRNELLGYINQDVLNRVDD